MRVATWNVNSLRARLTRVLHWLDYAKPDVLCIQETKVKDADFPYLELSRAGYHAVHYGLSQWNGVAVLSLREPEDVQIGFAEGWEEQEARMVSATIAGVNFSSVYVPNGRSLDNDHYVFKLEWMRRLAEEVRVRLDRGERTIVAGDYNIAPSDIDVWDASAFLGMTHVSKPERDALEALYQLGLEDVFRRLYPTERIYSWWDFRQGAFHKGHGMRIDLLLATPDVARLAFWGLMDREARKGEKPSDHAPVMIDFQM